jgi:uncharacterized protein (DUF305 family)
VPQDDAAPIDPEDAVGDDLNDDELDDSAAGTGLSWAKLLTLLAAFSFLGGAIGYFIATPRAPGEDSVEIGFYRDMITHHDQAIEMALMELANGEDPVVLGFAREVIIFQRYEIGRMDQSLFDWGVIGDRPETAMEWMDMPVPATGMPGLANDEQLAALEAARGSEADALFLDLMAEHHRGGVHMATYAMENAGDEGVAELARLMRRNQSIEINEYRQTAERLGFDIEIDPFVEGEDPFEDFGS